MLSVSVCVRYEQQQMKVGAMQFNHRALKNPPLLMMKKHATVKKVHRAVHVWMFG